MTKDHLYNFYSNMRGIKMRVCEPFNKQHLEIEAWLKVNSTMFCAYDMNRIKRNETRTLRDQYFKNDSTTGENESKCQVASYRGIKRFTVRASKNMSITVMAEAHQIEFSYGVGLTISTFMSLFPCAIYLFVMVRWILRIVSKKDRNEKPWVKDTKYNKLQKRKEKELLMRRNSICKKLCCGGCLCFVEEYEFLEEDEVKSWGALW